MEIFVGNLPFDITEQDILDAFSKHGAVAGIKMLNDRVTGKFRGIAFVTMDDEAQANAAIEALNNVELGGRPMRVDKSRERTQRFNGFGGGFRENRGGGSRGGFGGGRQGGGFNRGGGDRGGFNRGGFKGRGGFRDNRGGGEGFKPRFDDGAPSEE